MYSYSVLRTYRVVLCRACRESPSPSPSQRPEPACRPSAHSFAQHDQPGTSTTTSTTSATGQPAKSHTPFPPWPAFFPGSSPILFLLRNSLLGLRLSSPFLPFPPLPSGNTHSTLSLIHRQTTLLIGSAFFTPSPYRIVSSRLPSLLPAKPSLIVLFRDALVLARSLRPQDTPTESAKPHLRICASLRLKQRARLSLRPPASSRQSEIHWLPSAALYTL